jgi:hypothetical protein
VSSKRALILAPLALALLWAAMRLVAQKVLVDSASPSAVTTLVPPIVDYDAIFTGMREAQEERQLLSRLNYGESVSAGIRDQQIKALQSKMESLTDGSPDRAAAQKRLDAAIARDEAAVKAGQLKNEKRETADMARLFGKIESAVAVVAAKHGLAAPVPTTPAVPTSLDAITLNDLRDLLLKRMVRMEQAPDNLTPEVLSYLDEQYAADKLAAGKKDAGELTTTSGDAP